MGSPDRRRSGAPAGNQRRDVTKGKPESAPGFRGLPPLKEPVVASGHRAVLMGCSRTGKASWADLEPTGSGRWRYVGNVPAMPDLNQNTRSDGSSQRAGGQVVSIENVNWDGYACGVCETGSTPVPGKEDCIFWRCGECNTLYCAGGFRRTGQNEWSVNCPGCNTIHALGAHQETGNITELNAEQSNQRRTALSSSGSGSRKQLSGGAGGAPAPRKRNK